MTLFVTLCISSMNLPRDLTEYLEGSGELEVYKQLNRKDLLKRYHLKHK